MGIKLETSTRIPHKIATHIAKILLEEMHGYDDVVIIEKDDHFNPRSIIQRIAGFDKCQEEWYTVHKNNC